MFELNTTSNTRGHSKKMTIKTSRLNVRKYTFVVRIVEIWNSLPESVIQAKTVKTVWNRPRWALEAPRVQIWLYGKHKHKIKFRKWRKVAHQWCGFRGEHSGNKSASTVVAMVSYGIFYDQIQIVLSNTYRNSNIFLEIGYIHNTEKSSKCIKIFHRFFWGVGVLLQGFSSNFQFENAIFCLTLYLI